jgi:hypothetical protein
MRELAVMYPTFVRGWLPPVTMEYAEPGSVHSDGL